MIFHDFLLFGNFLTTFLPEIDEWRPKFQLRGGGGGGGAGPKKMKIIKKHQKHPQTSIQTHMSRWEEVWGPLGEIRSDPPKSGSFPFWTYFSKTLGSGGISMAILGLYPEI